LRVQGHEVAALAQPQSSRFVVAANVDVDGLNDWFQGAPADATLDCSDLADLFSPDAAVRLQGHQDVWCHPTLGVLTEPEECGARMEAAPAIETFELPIHDVSFSEVTPLDLPTQPAQVLEPTTQVEERTTVGVFAKDLRRISEEFEALLLACRELKAVAIS
jgi:hypothetical protein